MHNAVLDVKFSDTQTSSQDVSSASVFTYSAIGGEYSFQDDRLIGSTVLLLFRDGLSYLETEDDFTGVDKEFQLDNTTGTVTFPPDPWPALEAGEKVTVLYITGDATIVLTEPVTLAEAKAWCKIEVDDDDNIVTYLITAARQFCEGYTGQSFVERTVTACLRNDLGGIRLPYGPVNDVVSITDNEGNDVTIESNTFTGIKFLSLNYCGSGSVWDPKRNSDMMVDTEPCNIFTLVYAAGYSVLPKNFKTAVLMQIAWMYQNRGDVAVSSTISPEAVIILRPYKK